MSTSESHMVVGSCVSSPETAETPSRRNEVVTPNPEASGDDAATNVDIAGLDECSTKARKDGFDSAPKVCLVDPALSAEEEAPSDIDGDSPALAETADHGAVVDVDSGLVEEGSWKANKGVGLGSIPEVSLTDPTLPAEASDASVGSPTLLDEAKPWVEMKRALKMLPTLKERRIQHSIRMGLAVCFSMLYVFFAHGYDLSFLTHGYPIYGPFWGIFLITDAVGNSSTWYITWIRVLLYGYTIGLVFGEIILALDNLIGVYEVSNWIFYFACGPIYFLGFLCDKFSFYDKQFGVFAVAAAVANNQGRLRMRYEPGAWPNDVWWQPYSELLNTIFGMSICVSFMIIPFGPKYGLWAIDELRQRMKVQAQLILAFLKTAHWMVRCDSPVPRMEAMRMILSMTANSARMNALVFASKLEFGFLTSNIEEGQEKALLQESAVNHFDRQLMPIRAMNICIRDTFDLHRSEKGESTHQPDAINKEEWDALDLAIHHTNRTVVRSQVQSGRFPPSSVFKQLSMQTESFEEACNTKILSEDVRSETFAFYLRHLAQQLMLQREASSRESIGSKVSLKTRFGYWIDLLFSMGTNPGPLFVWPPDESNLKRAIRATLVLFITNLFVFLEPLRESNFASGSTTSLSLVAIVVMSDGSNTGSSVRNAIARFGGLCVGNVFALLWNSFTVDMCGTNVVPNLSVCYRSIELTGLVLFTMACALFIPSLNSDGISASIYLTAIWACFSTADGAITYAATGADVIEASAGSMKASALAVLITLSAQAFLWPISAAAVMWDSQATILKEVLRAMNWVKAHLHRKDESETHADDDVAHNGFALVSADEANLTSAKLEPTLFGAPFPAMLYRDALHLQSKIFITLHAIQIAVVEATDSLEADVGLKTEIQDILSGVSICLKKLCDGWPSHKDAHALEALKHAHSKGSTVLRSLTMSRNVSEKDKARLEQLQTSVSTGNLLERVASKAHVGYTRAEGDIIDIEEADHLNDEEHHRVTVASTVDGRNVRPGIERILSQMGGKMVDLSTDNGKPHHSLMRITFMLAQLLHQVEALMQILRDIHSHNNPVASKVAPMLDDY